MVLELYYCPTKHLLTPKKSIYISAGESIVENPQLYTIDEGFQIFFQTEKKMLSDFLAENPTTGHENFLWIQLLQPIITPTELLHFNVLISLSDSWLCENILPDMNISFPEIENWLEQKNDAIICLRFKLEQQIRDFQSKYTHETLKKLYVHQWSIALIQAIFDELANSESLLANNIKYEDVEKICEIRKNILKNLSKDLPSISELAKKTGMSTTKFKYIFKMIYQESPHQYFLNQRIETAKQMLETGQYTISQVAYKTGFNHPSSLTRLFQNKYKITPKKYFDLKTPEEV